MRRNTRVAKHRVLEAYRKTRSVSRACRAAGIGRRTFYDWLEADPEFAAAVANVDAVTVPNKGRCQIVILS